MITEALDAALSKTDAIISARRDFRPLLKADEDQLHMIVLAGAYRDVRDDLEYYQGLCDRLMIALEVESVGEIIGEVLRLKRESKADPFAGVEPFDSASMAGAPDMPEPDDDREDR
jgi:hypothetical protein